MEILFWVVSFALSLSSFSSVSSLGTTQNLNVSIYTPCLDDEECNKEGWSCFQYFCYPWSEKADAPSPKHFEHCRRSKDCPVGENGEKGECYRHHSRRRVTSGICLDSVDECYSHDECGSRKCCNGNCCDDAYFEALKAFPCTTNDGCKDLLLGELCCVNIMGALAFETSTPNWNKVCCDNNLGSPIVQIPQDISDEDLQKIDHQISRMGVLKESICKGQEYDFMEKLPSCGNFTTTTTTTTTTPPTPKTTQPKVQHSQTQTSDASHLVSILSNLFALCSLGVLLA